MTKKLIGSLLLSLWAIVLCTLLLLNDPLPQDHRYHSFSDSSSHLSIPNAFNVLSNLPFLVVGFMGVMALRKNTTLAIVDDNKYAYYALFIGVACVAFGSGYYHLWPDNHTLLWDRLPMTIGFMGLVSIITSEFIAPKAGKVLLIPLLVIGFLSVFYWYLSESNATGDLRPYIFVQFFPIIGIPIVLLFFTPTYDRIACYWWLLGSYLVAKLCEHFDQVIHQSLIFISGHSLKHIVAALGLYMLLKGLTLRTRLPIKTTSYSP